MATNDSNTPNNVTYIDPGNQTPEEKDAPDLPLEAGGETPPTEMTAEEAAVLAGEADKALHDIDGKQLEPPTLSDIPRPDHMGEEHSPGPGHDENAEQIAPDAPAAEEQATAKKGRGGKSPKAEKADKTPEQPDKDTPAAGDQPKKRGGKPPKAEKADKTPEQPDKKAPAAESQPKKRGRPPKADKPTPSQQEAPAPPEPEKPPEPKEAPRRNGTEQIVYLNLAELHPFINHPFGVRDDSEMKALVESVKEGGVNQPALVRPREDGGYEIIAGHRRQKASELAGYFEMPCIVREMTDDEAILAMTDDNLRQRSELLPSERAISLKMQVDAISHQGARTSGQNGQKKDTGQRSIDVVGERNGMSPKQVQRYISLTKLTPDLLKMVDEKQLGFTPAVEFSLIRPKNQNLIAVSIEGEQAKPSLAQAQRLRELDQKGQLNGDVIDGILSEEKREVEKVIITGAELDKYFGKDKTPREMKDQIIKLLDDWAGKEKEKAAPEQKAER